MIKIASYLHSLFYPSFCFVLPCFSQKLGILNIWIKWLWKCRSLSPPNTFCCWFAGLQSSFLFFFFKWHFHTICYRDCIHFPVWSLKSLLHSLCSYSVTGQGCSQIAKFSSHFLHWAFPWCFQFLIKFIHSGFLFVCFEVFVLLFYQFDSYFSGDSFLWAFSSTISMIPLSTQQFGRNMLVVMGLVVRKLNNSIHFLLAIFIMNS